MKAILKVDNNLSFEIEGESQKVVFEEIAKIQEVFSSELPPGEKDGESVYRVRENDGNKFYEKLHKKSGMTLSFGSHKKGNTLFPRRKDDDGNFVGKNGWYKWQPPAKESVA